ncbi:MAG: IPT/TIG domain-containing protein, partial [Acidobacteria bacterium]|nr:IPT/TIG domain-containing protein [Acidobacteriota bacterium]
MRRIILATAAAALTGLSFTGIASDGRVEALSRPQYLSAGPLALLNDSQRLVATPAVAYQQFGTAVAIGGDVAVVGAGGISGEHSAAYVFRRLNGTWTQEATLTVDDAGMMSAFGSSVAVSGNTVVVGAYRANEWRGLVYVFVHGAAGWSRQARLEAADGVMGDHFGESVAVDGDRVAVGAPGAVSGVNWSQGAVYVYGRSLNVWSHLQKLTTSDGASDDRFGQSVALQGDYVVAGAPGDDVAGVDGVGTARVFHDAGSVFVEQAILAARAGAASDGLGSSVALDGSTVLAGSPNVPVGGLALAGAVDVFVRAGTTWSHQQRIVSPEPTENEQLGKAVDISGSTALVGVASYPIGSNASAGPGCVFAFIRANGAWSGFRMLQAADGVANDLLGEAVAIDRGTVLAGAPQRQVDGNVIQGAAYVFDLPPVVLGVVPALGSTGGGTAVTVSGLHFSPDPTLTIGGAAAGHPILNGSTQITATTPPHV